MATESIPYWWETRVGVATLLATRASRLKRLVELNAPEIIIEKERRMVQEALMTFPVNEDARQEIHRSHQVGQKEVDEFLTKHGYFKGISGGDSDDAET